MMTSDIICANLISNEKLIDRLRFRAVGKSAWRDKWVSGPAVNLWGAFQKLSSKP